MDHQFLASAVEQEQEENTATHLAGRRHIWPWTDAMPAGTCLSFGARSART
jgi:hypothetical protein